MYRSGLMVTVVLIVFIACSCVNNMTIRSFDLGNGKTVRVTTGFPDDLLPIYYELRKGEELLQRCFISQETPEYETVKKLTFEMLHDESNQVFVLMQTAPERESLAFFDNATDFHFPCCSNDNGFACISKRNALADLLERDNPGLVLDRLEVR